MLEKIKVAIRLVLKRKLEEMEGTFNLNWPTFSDHLHLMFKDIYQEKEYADVTLVSNDQVQFKAHKIVLSTCSPVFKEIIDNNPSEHPLIYLRGIQSNEIESILQFMYLGEVKFYYERMGEFVKIARELEVKGVEIQNTEEDITLVSVTDDQNKETYQADRQERSENDIGEIQPRIHIYVDCPECGKIYNKKSEMLKHYRSIHGGIKYPCIQCDHQATDRGNLQKHIQSKHEGIKYPCSHCSYQATERGSLKRHIQSKHEGIKYPCDHCDYQARYQSDLQKHIESKHDGIKYSCKQCDSQFTDRGSLQKHIQSTHEGIKYPCNQCDSQFTDRSSLQKHIKSKHVGIKYPCNQCNYQATYHSDLQKHIQSKHEGIKYPCNRCDYQATQKINLKRHFHTSHE